MRRIYPTLLIAALTGALGWGNVASAQPDDDDDEMTFDPDDPDAPPPEGDDTKPAEGEGEGEGEGDDGIVMEGEDPDKENELPDLEAETAGGDEAVKADQTIALADTRVSWQDILVVIRKPFLKQKRTELLPTWGVTMNDNIIRHFQFGAQFNYYLTDVLAVGIEGNYYVKNVREPFDLVARQARRLPTVNKYNWGASLNFHYVPVYGKFAVLDKHLVHWESYFTAGVGITQSEVLPRDPAFGAFKNTLITPNIGASMRFFLTKFLCVNVGIRDYIFVDKFEPAGRGVGVFESPEDAKDHADSSLINNVVFQTGISFWFPTGFDYTTFR
jgi:outer membrane beta-barrel protein